jgi:ADP-ribose pyrophosphatase
VTFRVEAEREVFRGRVIRLVNRDLVLPNGRNTTFSIVEHPGAVAIVPVFDNGDVILLRQFRPSIGKELYEIPAGTLEEGESPLATAKREIVEETGFKARKWEKISEFYTAPGFCTELMHVFVARGLTPASADGDADEILKPVRMSLEKAIGLIRKKKVRDAKSIAGLLIYHGQRRKA